MRSTKMSNASLHCGSDDEEILPKSVVPVRAFQPDFLFKISSACDLHQLWDRRVLYKDCSLQY